MKKLLTLGLCCLLLCGSAIAATEQAKQKAIDDGLAWLASTQRADGSWYYDNSYGDLSATGSATLAFLGEGYRPGDGSAYDAVLTKAVKYIFDRAANDTVGKYFWPGHAHRTVYTTGIVTPVLYELGKANPNAVITYGSGAMTGMTYRDAMQSVMDWYTWGQNADGGWRYYPNYGSSDNSTAQWGALPYLYGESWGLTTPAAVKTGLNNWTNQVQNATSGNWQSGGSGYTNWYDYVNMAKTGGMLLEFAVMDRPLSDPDVQKALGFMTSNISFDHWNQYYTGYTSSQWYGGHMNNPYAMWAVFKGLEYYGFLTTHDNGTASPADDFLIGKGISSAPGGITIGQNWGPTTSVVGDWYSQYSEKLVGWQNANGSWSGNTPWHGALATGWYINILNATGAPPPPDDVIPEPGTVVLLGLGLVGMALVARRRKNS